MMRAQPVLAPTPTPRHLATSSMRSVALDRALSAPYSRTAMTTCIYSRPLCTTRNNNSLALASPLHSYPKNSYTTACKRVRGGDNYISISRSSSTAPSSEPRIEGGPFHAQLPGGSRAARAVLRPSAFPFNLLFNVSMRAGEPQT